MNRRYLNYIILLVVLFLIIRFSQLVFFLAIKFWYISVPIAIYLVWRFHFRKISRDKKHVINGLDPKNEIKTDPPTFEDEDNGD